MVKDTLKILHQMTKDFKIVSDHFEISNEILGDAYSVNAIMGTYYYSAHSANSLFHTLRKKCPNTEFFLVRIFCIWTECGEILRISVVRISTYLVRMRENTDQKNSVFGHFSRSETKAFEKCLFSQDSMKVKLFYPI